MRKPAAVSSLAIHASVILLLFSITLQPPVRTRVPDSVRLVPLRAPRLRLKEGGGGQRDPLPATRGRAPAAVRRLWVPPMVVRNEDPHLVVEPALLEAPEINIQSPAIGDPNGKTGMPSGSIGYTGGLGDGDDRGIGNGHGPRQGGVAVRAVARITRGPQVIYMQEPEYSEEARKARFQGTVILAIEVDIQGHPTNIRVVRSLGLGLDEKAIAAVERWKFRPAIAGDRPVPAPATVEVNFRLL